MAEVLEYPLERTTAGFGPQAGPSNHLQANAAVCQQFQTHQRVGFKRARAPLQEAGPSVAAPPNFKRNRVVAGHDDFFHGTPTKVAHTDPQENSYQKENHILKKAVAIQNEKLVQEKESSATLRQALLSSQNYVRQLLRAKEENQALRQALAASQDQVRHLEIENYSLKVHLRQTNCARPPPSASGGPSRDIF